MRLMISLAAVLLATATPGPLVAEPPELGAEVYLEPGQTPAQIDSYFKALAESRMPVARVFMMWTYLEPRPGVWDFSLWDQAFDAAKRHGVKITATLVPNSPPYHWGPRYFHRVHVSDMLETAEKRERARVYVEKVVTRYRDHPALDTWWLFNEPGQYPTSDPLAIERFRGALRTQYGSIEALNAAWLSDFKSFDQVTYDESWTNVSWAWPQGWLDWNRFWRTHVSDQVAWLGEEVRRIDTKHQLHTNPKNLIDFYPHYDLPGMKRSVRALGTSMHPAWDFRKVPRERYGMGVAWNNDFIRAASGPGQPYWVSELQGGDNLYSGFRPLSPDADDITQWVWTSIASGAERVIFWSLNARRQGGEAAEWAMLDYDGEPSARLRAAADIARVVNANAADFDGAKPIASPITVLVSRESALLQERKNNPHGPYEGYKEGLHSKSVLASYMALLQLGLQAEVQPIEVFDWEARPGRTIILADAMALSAEEMARIDRFVSGGGKLIALGLTGLFDENELSWQGARPFPLAATLGGALGEVTLADPLFTTRLAGAEMPTHLWRSLVKPTTGTVAARDEDGAIALTNRRGRGSSTWLPSGVAIGGWLNSLEPLATFLAAETAEARARLPFRFDRYHENVWMKGLVVEGGGYITAISNSGKAPRSVGIVGPKGLKATALHGEAWDAATGVAQLAPGKTIVLKWR